MTIDDMIYEIACRTETSGSLELKFDPHQQFGGVMNYVQYASIDRWKENGFISRREMEESKSTGCLIEVIWWLDKDSCERFLASDIDAAMAAVNAAVERIDDEQSA